MSEVIRIHDETYQKLSKIYREKLTFDDIISRLIKERGKNVQ
jgi:predicted CopG family antitoxin